MLLTQMTVSLSAACQEANALQFVVMQSRTSLSNYDGAQQNLTSNGMEYWT